MIQKIHQKATELIGLMDEYMSELNSQNLDDSQVFLSWMKAGGMMSNIKKQLDYERKTNGIDNVSEEDKTENIS